MKVVAKNKLEDVNANARGWGNIVGNYLLQVDQYKHFLIATIYPISRNKAKLAQCNFSTFHLITRELVKEAMPSDIPSYVIKAVYEGLYNKQRELYEKEIIQSNLNDSIAKLIRLLNVEENEVDEIDDIIYYKNCKENLNNHFEPLLRLKAVSYLFEKEIKELEKNPNTNNLLNLRDSILSINDRHNWNYELIGEDELH